MFLDILFLTQNRFPLTESFFFFKTFLLGVGGKIFFGPFFSKTNNDSLTKIMYIRLELRLFLISRT